MWNCRDGSAETIEQFLYINIQKICKNRQGEILPKLHPGGPHHHSNHLSAYGNDLTLPLSTANGSRLGLQITAYIRHTYIHTYIHVYTNFGFDSGSHETWTFFGPPSPRSAGHFLKILPGLNSNFWKSSKSAKNHCSNYAWNSRINGRLQRRLPLRIGIEWYRWEKRERKNGERERERERRESGQELEAKNSSQHFSQKVFDTIFNISLRHEI